MHLVTLAYVASYHASYGPDPVPSEISPEIPIEVNRSQDYALYTSLTSHSNK